MKKNYKNIVAISVMIPLIIGLSACSEDAQVNNTQNRISIIDCNTTGVLIPDDYVSMLSGDVLVEDANNTVVTTYHGVDGIKKVCTDSGIAYLIRK